MDTRSNICKHVRYVTYPMIIRSGNDRKRESLREITREINRKLSGHYDEPCKCDRCRTDNGI